MPAAIAPHYNYHYNPLQAAQAMQAVKRVQVQALKTTAVQTVQGSTVTTQDKESEALALLATLSFAGLGLVEKATVKVLNLFARRLFANSRTGGLVLLCAVVYVHRFIAKCGSVKTTQGIEFRLLAVALMLAFKMCEDNVLVRSAEWVHVCGSLHLDVKMLQAMERELLIAIDYDVLLKGDELKLLVSSLATLVHANHRSSSTDSVGSVAASRLALEILNQISANHLDLAMDS
ncbi:UNVERIFIED_CONTAM: hypothetical protein HDU68_011148 [Siphonaria sp. JEL0065]|nr:hypothetical protein HDU68_011148 [Siphonaria sp. JEL0065]